MRISETNNAEMVAGWRKPRNEEHRKTKLK
jgi:hypothetical protein